MYFIILGSKREHDILLRVEGQLYTVHLKNEEL